MPLKRNFVVYYKKYEGGFRCLKNDGKTYTDEILVKGNKDCSAFEMIGAYDEANDETLLQFLKDFNQWHYQLVKLGNTSIVYSKYFDHRCAVDMTLRRFSPIYSAEWKKETRGNKVDTIDKLENSWMSRCQNGGLIFCKPGTYNTFGYDYSSFYPHNLTKIKFPIKKGREITIEELPSKLKYGYYHVKITCDHPDIKKLFSFSKKNTYTNTSIERIRELQKDYDISMELVHDDKPNAYVYKNKDLVHGKETFGKWLDTLMTLKKKLEFLREEKKGKKIKKNYLLKHLLSSVWGQVCRKRTIYLDPDDDDTCMKKLGIDSLSLHMRTSSNEHEDCRFQLLSTHTNTDGSEYWKILDKEDPYFTGFARVKCFLTAYSRNKIGETAEWDIENCVRIHTDGVTFKKEQPHICEEFKGLLSDSKYTGHFEYISIKNTILLD